MQYLSLDDNLAGFYVHAMKVANWMRKAHAPKKSVKTGIYLGTLGKILTWPNKGLTLFYYL